jgi:hypothetical protein
MNENQKLEYNKISLSQDIDSLNHKIDRLND